MPTIARTAPLFLLLAIGGLAACTDPIGSIGEGRRWAMVAAGELHTCGLDLDGAAFCWGAATSGALGNATTHPATTPREVIGGFRFRSIASGEGHSCGIADDRTLYCWGSGERHELGQGAAVGSTLPVPVHGFHHYNAVTPGGDHTCGVTADGAARCWGWNLYGQLGAGTTFDLGHPEPVTGNLTFTALSAGHRHTCGVTTDRRVFCWGSNAFGQLGVPDAARSCHGVPCETTPREVAGGLPFMAIAAGRTHTCALDDRRAAFCWGAGGMGQLGTGGLENAETPVAVATDLRFASITAGDAFTCATTVDGAPYCWGSNEFGRLGTGTSDRMVAVPAAVASDRAFVSVSAGRVHACGVTSESVAYCWGFGGYGALGNGGIVSSPRPVVVTDG